MILSRRAMLATMATAAVLHPAARAQSVADDQVPATVYPTIANDQTGPALEPAPPTIAAAPIELPTWRRYAVNVPFADPRPKIAVVIDDLGVMHQHTQQAIALPGPLTLAWFPFAQNLAEQVQAAAARGHEAMLHMPMQAGSDSTAIAWTGPDPLRVDLPMEVNISRLRTALAAVPAIVGLNNHMGTVATRDPMLMDMMAQEAHARTMLFLDSVVISHSVALRCAELAGVPAAGRDVFIDNTPGGGDIRQSLASTEARARHAGYAIAIGHPRPHTLAALEEWLPTLAAKGFVLWPISATVALRNRIDLGPAV